MNFEEFEITPSFVLRGLFLVVAVVWMFLPEQAVAFSNSIESPLVPFSGCAADFGMSDSGMSGSRAKQTLSGSFSSVTELRTAFTPCKDEDRDADPQYNICFEGNPAPISTLPHLLAGLQAELASALVQNTAALFLDSSTLKSKPVRNGVLFENAHRSAERRMPPADRGATCSSSGDECSVLPGLPGGIEFVSGVPVLLPNRVTPALFAELLDVAEDEQGLWARLRVGPANGHGLSVDRPPIQL